ncbi:MAG: hypothetical protein JNK20_13615 [Flavipsychrobacter sp.]|nr:hypothetical protein [Flavipsychrobacter sp.]
MINILVAFGLSIILLTFSFEASSQTNVTFTDTKDVELYNIRYVVLAEGKLGDFRDDIRGNIFKNSTLVEFFNNNNRKIINVVFVRILSNKLNNKIDQISFYSVREQDTKLVEEITLNRNNDETDIDLLVAKTIL